MLNKKILFLFIYFLSISSVIIYKGISQPFPFISTKYVYELSEFNSKPETNFYKINTDQFNIDINDKIKFKNLIENNDIFKKIEFATNYVRSLQEDSLGTKIRIPNNILSNNNSFKEICSESSKIFVFIMSLLNEVGRVVWFNGHTVAEIWDGNKWILVDTSTNLMSYNNNLNRYSSLLETMIDVDNHNLKKITNKKYKLPDYFNSNAKERKKIINLYSSKEFLFFMNNSILYDFHLKQKKFQRVINSIFFNNKKVMGYKFIFDEHSVK